MGQVAWNKSSLLLRKKELNVQILQLFTIAIKMESIYKRLLKCQARLQRPSGLIKRGRKGKHFKWNCRKDLIKVENVLQE
jgi:hypothetical protein